MRARALTHAVLQATGIDPRAKGQIPAGAMAFAGGSSSGGVRISYDPRGGGMIGISPAGGGKGTTTGPVLMPPGQNLTLHVFVDGGLIEVVANGVLSLAVPVAQTAADKTKDVVQVFGGHTAAVEAWKLNSIWS